MKYGKISIALIFISFLVLTGCCTVEREMLGIGKKTYESFVFTGYSESEHHQLIIKLLKEVENPTAPVECEFIITNFVGDPGVCKQASLIVDNARYDLKVGDSKSELAMESASDWRVDRSKYRQKANSFDVDKMYLISGKFIIAADTRNKIKNAKDLTAKFQTYNKTITLKVEKCVCKEMKEYL
jgi:hypothetical protein